MEEIITFNPDYTMKDVQELVQWFKERMDKLPETLEISNSTKSVNLPFTVRSYLSLLNRKEVTPAWSGYYALLLLIKERLLEQGFS